MGRGEVAVGGDEPLPIGEQERLAGREDAEAVGGEDVVEGLVDRGPVVDLAAVSAREESGMLGEFGDEFGGVGVRPAAEVGVGGAVRAARIARVVRPDRA